MGARLVKARHNGLERRAVGMAALCVALGACSKVGPSTQAEGDSTRLDRLTRDVASQEARLAQLKTSIAEQEQKLLDAKDEVRFARCEAERAAEQAEHERQRAECARQIADMNRCESRNSKQTADSTLGGCLIGLAATALSGGAGAWAAAGCVGGRAVGDAAEALCVEPPCARDAKLLAAESAVPAKPCGVELGLRVRDASVRALLRHQVESVVAGGWAAREGIAAGDRILRVGGVEVGTAPECCAQALAGKRVGMELTVDVVRRDVVISFRGKARPLPDASDRAVKLGIQFSEEKTELTHYLDGVEVDAAVDTSIAARAGFTPGERLISLQRDGHELIKPTTAAVADRELGAVRAGTGIEVVVLGSDGQQRTRRLVAPRVKAEP